MIHSFSRKNSRTINHFNCFIVCIFVPCLLVQRRLDCGQIRSSRPELFCKIGALRDFAKVKGKHLFQSLFFNKVAGLSWKNFAGWS